MHCLVIGCGYLGLRVAARWREAGHSVAALTRSPLRAEELRRLGIAPFIGDVLAPESLRQLPGADVLLMSVGHDRAGPADKRTVYVQGLANVLQAIAGRVRKFIYTSSVSVYGQSDGTWVDESSVCEPASTGGQTCLDAESVLATQPGVETNESSRPAPDRRFGLSTNESRRFEVFILRLAGIYGPGRLLARIEELRAGQALGGEPGAWLNLIHVDDAVRAVLACGEARRLGGTYIVCDDRPVTRREYYTALAELVGAPAPRFDPNIAPRTRSSGLNKRCSNQKMRIELGVELAFPTMATGLPQAVR